jgi:predicted transcriptional regulator
MYHERQDEKQVTRTIHLRTSDLAALQQLLSQLVASHDADRPTDLSVSVDSGQPEDPGHCAALARRVIAARRLRSEFFKTPMFGEPAWDMLLGLYAYAAEGPRQSVGRLSTLSGSPATTALRWLDYLVKEQLVIRQPNPTDGRSDFVEMTDKGRSLMERYLSETLRIRV